MGHVFLVYSDNNESYDMHRVDLIGVYTADQLDDARKCAWNACTVQKNYSRDAGAPPFIGSTCTVVQWELPMGGGSDVNSFNKFSDANKIAREVAESVEKDYAAELALLQNAKEKDKAQRLKSRLALIGIN